MCSILNDFIAIDSNACDIISILEKFYAFAITTKDSKVPNIIARTNVSRKGFRIQNIKR